MHPRLILTTCLFLALSAASGQAQDVPPPGILNGIASQLPKRFPATKTTFTAPPSGSPIDNRCRMQPMNMTTERDTKTHTFSVLVDPQQGPDVAPKEMLARIVRLTVDADGSARAYHPEDPYGEGVCKVTRDRKGRTFVKDVCAVDNISSAGFRLFLETSRLKKSSNADQPGTNGTDLAAEWKQIWPLIRDRKIKPFNLGALIGDQTFDRYYGFYAKDQKLTSLFNKQIIPADNDGYPCRHENESRYPGYFIAATALARKTKPRNDGCAPFAYIDAEQVPFFVLPSGRFGQIEVGDIVVGYLNQDGRERLVFGIAADTGPFDQFGEGSIAFNRKLLNDTKFVMNAKSVNDLDIDLNARASGKEKPAIMAILILGGTKQLLKENYSAENVEKVGRREFARWTGSAAQAMQRLRSCATAASINSQ